MHVHIYNLSVYFFNIIINFTVIKHFKKLKFILQYYLRNCLHVFLLYNSKRLLCHFKIYKNNQEIEKMKNLIWVVILFLGPLLKLGNISNQLKHKSKKSLLTLFEVENKAFNENLLEKEKKESLFIFGFCFFAFCNSRKIIRYKV